jgi:hypothetical protein
MRARVCLDRQFILEELPRLTTSEIRVLLCLHLHHSAERGCWPSVKAIAGLTGLHRGSVHAAIASLKDKHLITIERVNGKPCYWLRVSDLNVLLGGSEKWPGQTAVSPRDDSRQGGVSPYDDTVSPYDDSGCHQETTVPRVPHAGAGAHTPNEVSIEETKEAAPPAAPGACINARLPESETPRSGRGDTQSAMDLRNRSALDTLPPDQQKAFEIMRRKKQSNGGVQ